LLAGALCTAAAAIEGPASASGLWLLASREGHNFGKSSYICRYMQKAGSNLFVVAYRLSLV
jgi:hypothetical protein